jgi:hypothetical protein
MVLKANGKRVNMEAVIDFMNQQSLSSQLFVLKKFEDSVKTEVKMSDNGEVYTPPRQKSGEVECPDAPLKESK